MNAEQQREFDEWWDEVGLDSLTIHNQVEELLHRILATQDTGCVELRRELHQAHKEVNELRDILRRRTQDTGGGDGLLRQVLQYNLGAGDFNFAKLPSYDKNNAAFDAWTKLKEDIEAYLATRSQDTGSGEEIWNAALETIGTGIGEMSRYSSYKDYLTSKKEGKV